MGRGAARTDSRGGPDAAGVEGVGRRQLEHTQRVDQRQLEQS